MWAAGRGGVKSGKGQGNPTFAVQKQQGESLSGEREENKEGRRGGNKIEKHEGW